jgi:magnesium transporter
MTRARGSAPTDPQRTREADPVAAAPPLALPEGSTVGDAVDELRRHGDEAAPSYVYVVDAAARLVGVVSMRDLVLARPATPLRRVMRTDVVSVGAADAPEAVARVLRRGRYAALPVVDRAGRLVGTVTADDVMDSIERDATEDVQQMFGAGPEERLTTPWHLSFRRRLPWLMVNLGLAAVGASVVGAFERTIGAWTVLAMYMPIVAGMGGNASAQAMAVAVRGIAVGDADRISLRRVVARELRVGAASGIVTGAAAAGVALVLHRGHGTLLGALVGTSLLINHTVACAWGAAIPFLMKWLGFDPAQSATIFTTTLTDVLGFFTLLGLASLSLNMSA